MAKNKGEWFTRTDSVGVWLFYRTPDGREIVLSCFAPGTQAADVVLTFANREGSADACDQR